MRSYEYGGNRPDMSESNELESDRPASSPRAPDVEAARQPTRAPAGEFGLEEDWQQEIAELNAEIEAQDKQVQKEIEDRRRKKYDRRAKTLEAIVPTGDPVIDARAFFEAIECEPKTLASPYDQAFAQGDRKGMLEYFEDRANYFETECSPRGDWEKKYIEALYNTVKKIISAAKDTKISQ